MHGASREPQGPDIDILAARRALYGRARMVHPERSPGDTREWRGEFFSRGGALKV